MANCIHLTLCLGILTVYGTKATDLIKSGNEYMEKILAEILKKYSDDLSTIRLPGFETNNRDRFLFMNVKVKTVYNNGRLHNLDKVSRLGDCVPDNEFPIIKLSCTIQFNNLRVDYNGRMKYGQLPKISINAKSTVRPVESQVVIVNDTVTNSVTLQAFDLVTPVEIDPSFTGIGLLNRYLKMLKDNFVDNVGHYVGYAIKKEFKAAIIRTISSNTKS